MAMFGFNFFKKDKEEIKPASPITPIDDEAAIATNTAGFSGMWLDLDINIKNEVELISRYRDIANFPDVDNAVEEITSEVIAAVDSEVPVDVDFDDEFEYSDKIKDRIKEEFDEVLCLLSFKNKGHDIFKRWYIDGRINYQKIIDPAKKNEGIKKLIYVDPRKIKKMREIKKEKLPNGLEVVKNINEFYLYSDKGFTTTANAQLPQNATGIRIALDTIAFASSGLYDYDKNLILSYLHKAIKPVNQLKMMTDAMVIYRLSRAPERRIFYIDVGNLPKNKAEEYMKGIMNKYRSKIVYDANTGSIKDNKHMGTMMEDYWLPRRADGKGTQIDTLPGANNLGAVEDIKLLQEQVYNSLNVPTGRLHGEPNVLFGRQAEVSRDEMKFAKFINRLRRKFNELFDDLLKTNLILKGIITEDDWLEIKEKLNYKYTQDQYFQEVKQAEILRNRIDLLNQVQPYVGTYFSMEYVNKEILKLTDEEIENIVKQNQENPPPMTQTMDGVAGPSSMQAAALTNSTKK